MDGRRAQTRGPGLDRHDDAVSIPPRTSYLSLPVEPIEDATSWLNRETENYSFRNMPSAGPQQPPVSGGTSRGIDKKTKPSSCREN